MELEEKVEILERYTYTWFSESIDSITRNAQQYVEHPENIDKLYHARESIESIRRFYDEIPQDIINNGDYDIHYLSEIKTFLKYIKISLDNLEDDKKAERIGLLQGHAEAVMGLFTVYTAKLEIFRRDVGKIIKDDPGAEIIDLNEFRLQKRKKRVGWYR